ncbi:MAG: UDP-N-acetylglucosamine 2-epimerase (non-hydrolyzing) [Dehalococcoidia bacterium]|nr:UDP-N-acetylglucosamine 2-epimerase (non-hydrolyzing) [Dehalococcoidia bacterium]
MRITLVAATRPNFMKIAPLIRAIDKHNTGTGSSGAKIEYMLVHSGQHYDYQMSQVFFEDLELVKPDIHLGVGSGTHAWQTGSAMMEFEKVLLKARPDLVVVVGDVNSALAGALAAVKLHIPVAHVEAGVRTGDMGMAEEVNRLLTDHISHYLFTTSKYDDADLKKEGIPAGRIHRVGNIMADSLVMVRESAGRSDVLNRLGVKDGGYALLTLHRPANVDEREKLKMILSRIEEVSRSIPVVFPAHPRTLKNLLKFGLDKPASTIILTTPLGYRDMLRLEMGARFVITDSGGVQVEAAVLGVPCLTVMDYPVWRITHETGGNKLVGSDCAGLEKAAARILKSPPQSQSKPKSSIPLWDGHTADRIVSVLLKAAS